MNLTGSVSPSMILPVLTTPRPCHTYQQSCTSWHAHNRMFIPYHGNDWSTGHVLTKTGEEFLWAEISIVLLHEFFAALYKIDGYRITMSLNTWRALYTCWNFIACMVNPFCSNRLIISPIRPLCTPSGLIMIKVLSFLGFSAILETLAHLL